MISGLRTAQKITPDDFATAGTGLGKVTDLKDLSAAGCNVWSIRVRATSASAVSEIDLGETLDVGDVVIGHKITQGTTQTVGSDDVSLGYAADPDYLGAHAKAGLATAGLSVTSAYATPVVVTTQRALQIASTTSGSDASTLQGDYLIQIWGYTPATVDLT
ncbi:MAG: hypothetical protein GY851_34480 [bacterium]|nr:hypothetical protein [bacterium]